jgi:hypothetical protein
MLRKSKTIHEIYNEVSGYDLVITNDAPLATALNKLVDKPRLGYLAMTPKQIAKKFAGIYYERIYDKFEIILSVFKNNYYPLNLLHQTVKKIYEIWLYNAKFEHISMFLSEDENRILALLSEFETIENVMENFNEDYYGNKKIAVIGEEIFTLLDREVLISRGTPADRLELFKDEEYSIDKTYVFGSDESLAENLTELINKDNEDETAIVLNTDSEYLEIIKSVLIRKGLKIEEKYYLRDDLSVRTFISFLELSPDIENIEFKELIPLANEFGIKTQSEFSQYNAGVYVKKVSKDNKLKAIFDICKNIGKMNFNELVSKLRLMFEYEVSPEFIELLESSEMGKVKISDKSITDLKYILKEFDIETSSEKSGILFVNAKNSSFIDRKLIFYIGLDDTWMRVYPDKDYLNKEEEEEKNRLRFQILIQQGEKKYYFVRNTKNYEEVIPCYYFSILSEKKADSFNDAFFNPVHINSLKVKEDYSPDIDRLPVKLMSEVKLISPTDLNAIYKCPKYYSFKRLFPNENNPNMKRGILFHSFAELYFNHPEFTNENMEAILDLMVEEMSYFTKNIYKEFVKSEFRIGTESIINFLEETDIKKLKITDSPRKTENILMDAFRLKKLYSNTEGWIIGNDKTPVKGKIDLQYENKIVDYKSSASRKKDHEVTYQSNIDYINRNEYEKFDFQAVAYISSLRDKSGDVKFIYNFLLSNFRKQVNIDADREECITEIKYFDLLFSEHIRQDRFFDLLMNFEKPGKFLKAIGKENYLHILDNLNLNEQEYFDKELLTNRFLEISHVILEDCKLNYKNFNCRKEDSFNDSYVKPIALRIYNERSGKGGYGTVFKDDCDAFIKMAKDKISEINEYNKTFYPAAPVFESREICKKCDYLNLCMGNKLWH